MQGGEVFGIAGKYFNTALLSCSGEYREAFHDGPLKFHYPFRPEPLLFSENARCHQEKNGKKIGDRNFWLWDEFAGGDNCRNYRRGDGKPARPILRVEDKAGKAAEQQQDD